MVVFCKKIISARIDSLNALLYKAYREGLLSAANCCGLIEAGLTAFVTRRCGFLMYDPFSSCNLIGVGALDILSYLFDFANVSKCGYINV